MSPCCPPSSNSGAFTHLEDDYHHLHVFESTRDYNPARTGVDQDLRLVLGPIEPVLVRVNPLLLNPPNLTREEFENLLTFCMDGPAGPAG